MRFNPRARLDPGQIRVSTGGGRRGRVPLPLPSGRAGGGSVIGLVVIVVIYLVVNQLSGPDGSGQSVSTSELTSCRTGADAARDDNCARAAIVNSVQAYWTEALPDQTRTRYREADTVIFSGGVDTGCGFADSSAGPFYCPADSLVYLDTTFFDEILDRRLGASGGQFEEAYVLAHEYGHHVQDLLGTMDRVRRGTGADSDSVRLELQADCYAGLWAHHATTVPDEQGQPFILELTRSDIEAAISAATAVGDDRIQRQTTGKVRPDQWTHGSAEQRVAWFLTGYRSGRLASCDTFG